MNIQVLLKDGRTTSIPNCHWHPEWRAHVQPGFEDRMPAGVWVRKSELEKYNCRYNVECAKMFPESHINRTLDDFIELIECAEMPFEILDDETQTPWKNFGNMVKSVPAGQSDYFWTTAA